MTDSLTERQKTLLSAIIKEFIETAEAVGSIHLPEKYSLGLSPATIRNEMVDLVEKGYLTKPHSSSGRIPTSIALKLFVHELLDELESITVEREMAVKQDILASRFEPAKLIRSSVKALADLTGNAAVGLLGEMIYYAGIGDILDYPEYDQPRRIKRLLSMIENYDFLYTLFSSHHDEEVEVLIGEEDIGDISFERVAIIFTQLKLYGGKVGYLAVVGPHRMNYAMVIPTVKWLASTVNQSVTGW